MREVWLLAGLMSMTITAPAAEDVEPVDADFLEYLGTLEEDDSNWTLLADAKSRPRPAKKPQPEPKPSEEPAQPATKDQ